MERIKSYASPNEHSSPFYQKNKLVCEKWEEFIIGKGGEVSGKYSAWALVLEGRVDENTNQWNVKLNKSTMTKPPSIVNLIIKSNVVARTIFEIKKPDCFGASFKIRCRRKLDRLRSGIKMLDKNYVIVARNHSLEIDNSFIKLINEIDSSHKLEYLEYDNSAGILKFVFKEIISDFAVINKMLGLFK